MPVFGGEKPGFGRSSDPHEGGTHITPLFFESFFSVARQKESFLGINRNPTDPAANHPPFFHMSSGRVFYSTCPPDVFFIIRPFPTCPPDVFFTSDNRLLLASAHPNTLKHRVRTHTRPPPILSFFLGLGRKRRSQVSSVLS